MQLSSKLGSSISKGLGSRVRKKSTNSNGQEQQRMSCRWLILLGWLGSLITSSWWRWLRNACSGYWRMQRLGDGRRQRRQQDRWRWRVSRRSRKVEHMGVGQRLRRAWFHRVKLAWWQSSWRYWTRTSRRPTSMAFKTRCCCWPSSMRWV